MLFAVCTPKYFFFALITIMNKFIHLPLLT